MSDSKVIEEDDFEILLQKLRHNKKIGEEISKLDCESKTLLTITEENNKKYKKLQLAIFIKTTMEEGGDEDNKMESELEIITSIMNKYFKRLFEIQENIKQLECKYITE